MTSHHGFLSFYYSLFEMEIIEVKHLLELWAEAVILSTRDTPITSSTTSHLPTPLYVVR